jgi:hypothetical protein
VRGRVSWAVAAPALVLVTACAADRPADDTGGVAAPTDGAVTAATDPSTTAPATTASADGSSAGPTLAPADVTEPPCFPTPGPGARWLSVPGSERQADALALGEGSVGIVLAHQSDGSMCEWVPFAEELVDRGYAVVMPAFDRDAASASGGLVQAAVDHLAGSGVASSVLMGASMGGTYVIAAAPGTEPAPAAVLAISPPDHYRGADAMEGVGDLGMPLFLAAGDEDRGFADDARALAEGAGTDVELLVVPSHLHGVDLVVEDNRVQEAVLAFLEAHAPPS